MAKICSLCGRKLGVFDGKVAVADGIVCLPCWAEAGMDMSFRSMYHSTSKTVRQVMDLIELEHLKMEAMKEGYRSDPGAPAAGRPTQLPDRSAGNGEPVDIIFGLDQNNGVDFICKGHPRISFDDLIHGREMIIGDGIVRNRSGHALPDVNIVCEVEPPIFDPGALYYKEGTFGADFDGRFEIDDPPVNIEEYAKIRTTRTGKVSFTLYFGEQKIHTAECPLQIDPAPAEEMEALQNAILYEQEKHSEGPVNVLLSALGAGVYDMDLMRTPQLLYSMYANGQEQLIGDVYVRNETASVLRNVKFEAKFASNILSPVKILLGDVPPGQQVRFEVDDPAIDVEKLEMLTDLELTTATYKILVNGRTVAESTGKVTICPYNQWNSAMILLPAYMTPNHPYVIQLLQEASKWLMQNGKDPSLEGYQGDPLRVDEMVCGVYHAMKRADIIYSNPPASFFGPQRIRLCETVLEQKFATCLDMTLLFASCLESFQLHPVLITAPGHIFAGVWTVEQEHLKEPVVSDAGFLQKMIEEKKLIVVECTAMNAGKEVSYDQAKQTAEKTVRALAERKIEDHECIDVQIVRAVGIKPVPIRAQHSKKLSFRKPVEADFAEQAAAEWTVTAQSAAEQVAMEHAEPVQAAVRYGKEPYRSYERSLSEISMENFYDKDTRKVLKDTIAEIVSIEGPVSQSALIRTLIRNTNISRTNKQISDYLDKLVTSADVKITRQNGERFLWKREVDPAHYRIYRVQEKRDVEAISKYELKNAVCYLIQENGAMDKEKLGHKMVELFGYSRSSKRIEDSTAFAIKAARELKAIQKLPDGTYSLLIE